VFLKYQSESHGETSATLHLIGTLLPICVFAFILPLEMNFVGFSIFFGFEFYIVGLEFCIIRFEF
jgi:hypothetical protein